jgi:hypothetical protein
VESVFGEGLRHGTRVSGHVRVGPPGIDQVMELGMKPRAAPRLRKSQEVTDNPDQDGLPAGRFEIPGLCVETGLLGKVNALFFEDRASAVEDIEKNLVAFVLALRRRGQLRPPSRREAGWLRSLRRGGVPTINSAATCGKNR